jgi:hypothetical protein
MRIMVGLLYWNTVSQRPRIFPHQPNHAPYAPFTLNPGLQGLLKLVGGLLLALGLFTRTVAFCPRGRYGRSPISWCTRREMSSRCSTRGVGGLSTRSSSSISGSPGAANGASIECARRIGIRRVAEPGLSTAIARKPRKLRLCRSPPGRPPAAGCTTGGSPTCFLRNKNRFRESDRSNIFGLERAYRQISPDGARAKIPPTPRVRSLVGLV